MRGNRILLIESDQRFAQSILSFLQGNGFVVWNFGNGGELSHLLRYGDFDLVLSELRAAGEDDLDLIRGIRRNFEGPYLVLSSMNKVCTQVRAFDLGIDDFISKSEDLRILRARICAHLRGYSSRVQKRSKNLKIKIDNLTIDRSEHCATVEGEPIPLSTGEFELLWMLATHQKQALSREFLFVNVLGRQYDGLDRAIDRRVFRLRKKLGARSDLSLTVRTVWGQGYMLAGR